MRKIRTVSGGFSSDAGPAEMKPFRSSVLNHLFYGFGLWWSATVLRLG